MNSVISKTSSQAVRQDNLVVVFKISQLPKAAVPIRANKNLAKKKKKKGLKKKICPGRTLKSSNIFLGMWKANARACSVASMSRKYLRGHSLPPLSDLETLHMQELKARAEL